LGILASLCIESQQAKRGIFGLCLCRLICVAEPNTVWKALVVSNNVLFKSMQHFEARGIVPQCWAVTSVILV